MSDTWVLIHSRTTLVWVSLERERMRLCLCTDKSWSKDVPRFHFPAVCFIALLFVLHSPLLMKSRPSSTKTVLQTAPLAQQRAGFAVKSELTLESVFMGVVCLMKDLMTPERPSVLGVIISIWFLCTVWRKDLMLGLTACKDITKGDKENLENCIFFLKRCISLLLNTQPLGLFPFQPLAPALCFAARVTLSKNILVSQYYVYSPKICFFKMPE